MSLKKIKGIRFSPGTRSRCHAICLLLILVSSYAKAQVNLVKAEYFFDSDPGFGNGVNIPITPGNTITNAPFNADITALSTGIHQFFVRVKDANGHWSITNRSFLYKAPPATANPLVNITAAEYFFNSDPGFGKGTAIPVTAGTVISDQQFTADINALPGGIHQFFIRVKDANGRWSVTNRSVLYKPAQNGSSVPADIVQAEYFFDTDPGFGKAVVIPVSPGTTLTNIVFNADVNTLQAGIHQLFVRVKNASGQWSISNRTFLYKSTSSSSSPANIIRGEYFIDTDPGFGKAIVIPVSPSGVLSDQLIDVTVAGLAAGTHKLYVRVQDNKGNWSITNVSNLEISVGNTNPPSCAVLTAPADLSVNLNTNTILSWEAATGEPTGYFVHIGTNPAQLQVFGVTGTSYEPVLEPNKTYYWRVVPYNVNGSPASCPLRSFSTRTCIVPSITAQGASVLCGAQPVTLTASQASSYRWNTGDTTRSLVVTTPGSYTVQVNTESGCSNLSQPFTVTRDVKPVINSGNIKALCPGESITLSYSSASNVSWSTGSTSNSITVTPSVSTTYRMQGISAGGCTYTDSIHITVNPAVTPGAVTNMLPATGSAGMSVPFNLSWQPGLYNTRYDIYIWPSSQAQPATPTVSNTGVINVTVTSSMVTSGITYNWRVVSKNGNCFNTAGPIQTFATKNLPDLQVQQVDVPSIAASGNNLSVSWTVKNGGTGSTENKTWLDHIWLSADMILQDEQTGATDIYLGGVPNLTSLLPGETYNNSATFKLPNGVGGAYYVIVRSNGYDRVYSLTETNYANNHLVSSPLQVDLTPSPDLQVTTIVSPISVFSGVSTTVQWTVTNKGYDITDVNTYWKDKVYLSFSPFFNINTAKFMGEVVHNGGLLHEESYTASTSIRPEESNHGLYYIYVITDADNRIFEDPYENNNVNSKAVDVFLSPPADLQLQSLSSYPSASTAAFASMTWVVRNIGAKYAANGWTDKLYVSSLPTFDINQATQIGDYFRQDTLYIGDSYWVSMGPKLPKLPAGQYYLYAVTNATSKLFEHTFRANNVKRSDVPLTVYNPDLSPAELETVPNASSGEVISLNWKLNNLGAGDIHNRWRMDSIYLSTQPVFSYASAIALRTDFVEESITGNTSLPHSTNVKLPEGISGNYYIYLHADATDSIFENGQESNNRVRSSIPISISLTPFPDLVVTRLTVPDTLRAGFNMPVSFTVKNNGNAPAVGKTWYDELYVSSSVNYAANTSKLVKTFLRSQSLQPGAEYSVDDTALIQVDADGKLIIGGQLLDSSFVYFHLKTDASNELYEFNGENNNILVSTKVYVIPPRIDLDILQVSTADTADSGLPAFVQWQVRNNGIPTRYQTPPFSDSWLDGAYLSKDTVLDAADIFLQDWPQSNLPANGSYQPLKNFTVPNGLSGDHYLFVVTDHKTQVAEDVNRANNTRPVRELSTGKPKPIYIRLTASPDLTITKATVPAEGTAGQPQKAVWTIQNKGAGKTNGTGWQDGIFLSTDLTLDASDILIGSRSRTQNLLPGEMYEDSLEYTLPATASGNYVLILVADWQNLIYEHEAENNNSSYSFLHVTQPLPADLIATNIQQPLQGIAGNEIPISYTIRNAGTYPANGMMSDAIYLSADSVWDISDALIGTVSGQINLAPNGEIQRTANAVITGTGLGQHHVIIKTDRLNNIIETNDANNTGISTGKILIDVKPLLLNTLTPDLLKNDKYLYYRIDIPSSLTGQSLLIKLNSDTVHAGNELYVRRGDIPSRAVFDFNHGTLAGAKQELLIPLLKEGTYYLAVYGNNSNTISQQVTLHASILPFAIRYVNSNKGGNTGVVTLRLDGSRFEPGMVIKLNGADATITATQLHFVSSTTVFASFNLLGRPQGVYSVTAQNSAAETATLTNGFEIVKGSGGGFYVSDHEGTAGAGCDPDATNGINSLIQATIQHPSSTRPDRVVAITIFFGNSGNVDLPIPTRFIYSLDGAPLGFSVAELSENKHELSLEFRETNGPPNILRPGATGAITIYTKATAPLNFLLSD
jgi:hypothetical protein